MTDSPQSPLQIIPPCEPTLANTIETSTRAKLKKIYVDIAAATDACIRDLNKTPDQLAWIPESHWNYEISELMKEAFDSSTTPSSLTTVFSQVLPERPITISILIRSLITAAVKLWAMSPNILGGSFDETARNPAMIALQKAIIQNSRSNNSIHEITPLTSH